jgi:tripeptide aminopeptidase
MRPNDRHHWSATYQNFKYGSKRMQESALKRFIRYVKIDTEACPESTTYPSSEKQWDLLKLLAEELRKLGVPDVRLDEYGYVMASIPSNLSDGKKTPAIGFIAHVDTSPDVTGKDVNPQIIEAYDSKDIVLNHETGLAITVAENPRLKNNIGKTLVTTDGKTLLGADDKAGIAIIMTVVDQLINDPSIPHGDIKIAFTPDEEIGEGTKFFDLSKFGADFAYTLDGDAEGNINKETFSASEAIVTARGYSIHPGCAKGLLVNSLIPLSEVLQALPKNMTPETTEGYEPFIHPHHMEGNILQSRLKMILRDFNTAGLEDLKKIVENVIADVQERHPKVKLELEVNEQYKNMNDFMGDDNRVTHYLEQACKNCGIDPKWIPIRGGTDGSILTEKGLPTPNIFTGAANCHSEKEWLAVGEMESSIRCVLELIKLWSH